MIVANAHVVAHFWLKAAMYETLKFEVHTKVNNPRCVESYRVLPNVFCRNYCIVMPPAQCGQLLDKQTLSTTMKLRCPFLATQKDSDRLIISISCCVLMPEMMRQRLGTSRAVK